MSNDDNIIRIKIILLGEENVGKTSLINAYFSRPFQDNLERTKQKEEHNKTIELKKKVYSINIWDTMGQEKYRALTKNFIFGSHIVIFVYDIAKRETFLELDYWINTVNQQLSSNDAIFGIVANKSDLFLEEQVKKEEGMNEAEKIGAVFTEASAKSNPLSFKDYVNKLLAKLFLKEKIIQKEEDIIQLKEKKEEKKDGCC